LIIISHLQLFGRLQVKLKGFNERSNGVSVHTATACPTQYQSLCWPGVCVVWDLSALWW